MKILIVGSGGREHALAWACSRSSIRPQITVAPGNGGTSQIARNIDVSSEDVAQLEDYVRAERFDLTIIGPEAPSIAGLADRLSARGFRVFGPSSGAAKIEGSKAFSKKLMAEAGIPTAQFEIFSDKKCANDYIRSMGAPIVVKVSGIAAGKGAIVCKTVGEAFAATKLIFEDNAFGVAGNEVVVEAFGRGKEVSMTALVDGTDFLLLPSSRDHKQIFDQDRGPNTGGMGAYAPVDDLTEKKYQRFAEMVLPKLLKGLENAGSPFRGAIYPGLMVDGDDFIVLEVNARFGDPETQVLLPILNFDMLEAMAEIAEGSFGSWMKRRGLEPYDSSALRDGMSAATIVATAPGYPGAYPKGVSITGIPEESDNLIPFHAGTKKTSSGLVTNGGRVFSVTGMGSELQQAVETAYEGMAQVKFDGIHYRRDIGKQGEN